ncbi:MAG: hypothetical protein Q7S32_01865 [bacterium]|nr:hypothetical protein [bacterium]
MIISYEPHKLMRLSRDELLVAIKERREALRYSRDQRGDDRCFLDDYKIWAFVEDTPRFSAYFLNSMPMQVKMSLCVMFYEFCRTEEPDPVSPDAILDSARWNEDIGSMFWEELLGELIKIQQAIVKHRDILDRPRTAQDYRDLYSVLPEKVPADFRLPPREEFLGRAKNGAGCPQFWESHEACLHFCDLHQWGPCGV